MTHKRFAAFTLATWFGCGRSPIAPGTVGTIGALPLFFLLRSGGPIALLGAAFVLTLIGVWAAGIVEAVTASHDPQIVVIDEVVGVLIALAAAPMHSTAGIVLAVILFRFFDITKPQPARAAEKLRGGWGVMMDDVAAGIWAACVLLLLRAFEVIA